MMMISTMVRLATTTTMAHLCHDLRAHRTIFAKVFTSIVSCARSFAEESSERRVHHCHHWPEMMLVNHSRLRGHSGRGAKHWISLSLLVRQFWQLSTSTFGISDACPEYWYIYIHGLCPMQNFIEGQPAPIMDRFLSDPPLPDPC